MKLATALATTALCIGFNAPAASPPAGTASHAEPAADTLRFYNLHTRERLVLRHRQGQPASDDANTFLRDWRKGSSTQMDSRLFDALLDLQHAIYKQHPRMTVEFHVISGYRSAETNQNLRANGGGQASKSRHMTGMAIDIRVPGLTTTQLRDLATCVKSIGGVGYYANDGFVHIDVDNRRYWPSRSYLGGLPCAVN